MTREEIKKQWELEFGAKYEENQRANVYTATDILDFAESVVNKLLISGVVRTLVCVDGVLPNLTEGKEYEILEETNRHYNLIDDNGNDVLVGKSYMRELKQAN